MRAIQLLNWKIADRKYNFLSYTLEQHIVHLRAIEHLESMHPDTEVDRNEALNLVDSISEHIKTIYNT